MMQVITPRQWIKGELEKLVDVLNRENLSDEERLVLLKHRLLKFQSEINNPLMYSQELK